MTDKSATSPAIFIDGEAGTTGLQIRDRLERLGTFELLSIDPARRKDEAARRELMTRADLMVLCLPDDAARQAVSMADGLRSKAPRIVDASTAHRIADGWVYGFAELAPGQREAIARAARVANPGCYPTGAIALIRPLVEAGLMAPDHPVSVNAVSGYSGGGRQMIEAYEAGDGAAFQLYGLGMDHKHLPEMRHYSGLTRAPLFIPSVGNFPQGMIVSVPLHLDLLPGKPQVKELEAALQSYYQGSGQVDVVAFDAPKLAAEAFADTDRLELSVFGSEAARQAVLTARLDNLGKGAAGAAVQNIQLMLT